MPSFTVTAAGQSVALDQAGGGQAAFTVTNTTAAPITGRLIVTPQAPAAATWFTVAEPSTRTFAPGTAENVTAQIVVPAGTAAGAYSFRLDAIAEANPDEDFTEGPPVSFQVAPAPVAAKKPFPWWILIIVALVLIGGGAAFALTRGGSSKPGTPTVTAPTANQVIEASPPIVTVAYNPVADATSYRVQVQACAAEGCGKKTTSLFDLKTGATTPQQFQVPVGSGAHVTASKGDKAGDPSAWVAFTARSRQGFPCRVCKRPIDKIGVHALSIEKLLKATQNNP